jgi:ADP-ribose pyrophosphatase YjhB (NUDIX family)
LLERNFEEGDYFIFIGGGLEVGERLDECIKRELQEESNAQIVEARYVQVFENIYESENILLHGLEHYFEVLLQDEDVKAKASTTEYIWQPIAQLTQLDLHPHTVRDQIASGKFGKVRWLTD